MMGGAQGIVGVGVLAAHPVRNAWATAFACRRWVSIQAPPDRLATTAVLVSKQGEG